MIKKTDKKTSPVIPAGLYEKVLSQELKATLDQTPAIEARSSILPSNASQEYLSRHVHTLVLSALASFKGSSGLSYQVDLVNRIVDFLTEELPERFSARDRVTESLLEEVYATKMARLADPCPLPRPSIPMSFSSLLVNATEESQVGWQLHREIPSADRIDLLCSFIKWSGVRLLKPALKPFLESGKRLRILTTVYMGATQSRALDELVAMGANVKVSYETRRTRLHAKAWLLHRDTGFTTAYVGSSNLSEAAQMNGVEWNVRVSNVDAPQIVQKFEGAFETYWKDPEYRTYGATPSERHALDRVLHRERSPEDEAGFVALDIRPYPFQQEILECLSTERELHGRQHNLIVAATGTGKTVMAALDYRRLRIERGVKSLLFVAHRKEILKQSLLVFQLVLKDSEFGELMVGGVRPQQGLHVFASVQTLSNRDLSEIAPNAFDMIIIDEFHHAAASTYDRLLKHFEPRFLLGLTATPERADGRSVLHWFDNHVATELRLWDAIALQLLVPFHYFGIHDEVDLSRVQWIRGRYNQKELTALYDANHRRANLVVRAVRDKVEDALQMRALGFCVGVAHAQFMAMYFSTVGIPALAVTGASPRDERSDAVRMLRKRELNILFTVDVFSEGVDIPEVDTVLFLRPTESATVFLQQLGRGLRRHQDKDHLTVLDFIGHQHRNFRFDARFTSLLGSSWREAVRQIETGFPRLPSGCAIQLDRRSQDTVLRNVRSDIARTKSRLVAELRRLGPETTLACFLREAGVGLYDLYRGLRTMASLRRAAGFSIPAPGPQEVKIGGALVRLLHIDEPERLEFCTSMVTEEIDLASLTERKKRAANMFLSIIFGRDVPMKPCSYQETLRQHPALCYELNELFGLLQSGVKHKPRSFGQLPPEVPLALHCRYSLQELMGAFKHVNKSGALVQPREGVVYLPRYKANLLLVTLDKSSGYSSSTSYRDFAVSAQEFHWQSQNTTTPESKPGRRHIEHVARGITPLLFVRRSKKIESSVTSPYTFLGPVEYVRHEGARPMSVTWHLSTPMPAEFLRMARRFA